MIHNSNGSPRQWDDFVLQRWENEGGCPGSYTMTERDSHQDAQSRAVSDAEPDLIPSAIDCAMSDDTFVDQLIRRSRREEREVHWASAT